MISKDLALVLDVLKALEEAELAVGELYRTCAHVWEEDKVFWLKIEAEEMKHARGINKLADILHNKTEQFEVGRSFNPVAINTFIKGIQANIKRLQSGGIPKNNMLFIARDIEQSIIEFRYAEVVKTNDVQYNTLVEKIVSDTVSHKTRIDEKINAR